MIFLCFVGASVNTTEGEKAKEVSVQNRVFGSLPTLHSSGHTVSDYTLDGKIVYFVIFLVIIKIITVPAANTL